jgi:hypothetical protein
MNRSRAGVAVVRAHAEPKTVGTQAIAVTERHQFLSAQIHIPTLTTTLSVGGAVITDG